MEACGFLSLINPIALALHSSYSIRFDFAGPSTSTRSSVLSVSTELMFRVFYLKLQDESGIYYFALNLYLIS
jgi:hypothetical protein